LSLTWIKYKSIFIKSKYCWVPQIHVQIFLYRLILHHDDPNWCEFRFSPHFSSPSPTFFAVIFKSYLLRRWWFVMISIQCNNIPVLLFKCDFVISLFLIIGFNEIEDKLLISHILLKLLHYYYKLHSFWVIKWKLQPKIL